MKKLLLLIMLMVGFMSFSPVEKGDQLKTDPFIEDVQLDVMDLQVENQWLIANYNIPLEPGYTVSTPLAGNYTSISTGAILNSSTEMSDNIAEERYRQNSYNSLLQYNSTGYPMHEDDNFVRWLICYPERSSLL